MNTILADSHCHLDRLDLTPFNDQLALAIRAANAQDVKYFLNVSITLDNFPQVLQIAREHENVYASVGLHPTEITPHEPSSEQLVSLANDELVVAIGETGLDYYRSEGDTEWQRNRFRQHIRAARKTGKPLIVHTRQAREDTIRILKEEDAAEIGGVMHCFTEDWHMAQQAIDCNFYISFSGIVTFQNAVELKEVAKKVPLDKMLIETDAPYLAPVPHRGKANQPAYVRHVAEYIAGLRNVPYATIAECTTNNFFKLFKISR